MTVLGRVLEAALRLCREGGGWVSRSKAVVARVRAGHSGSRQPSLDIGAEPPDPVVAVYMRGIDRTLIRHSLRMTHEERIGALQDWINATDEARGAAGREPGREPAQ